MDNIGRLVRQVCDDWNRPKARSVTTGPPLPARFLLSEIGRASLQLRKGVWPAPGQCPVPSLVFVMAHLLAAVLQQAKGTVVYIYADDIGDMCRCTGNTVEVVRRRSQQAADDKTKWALDVRTKVAGRRN